MYTIKKNIWSIGFVAVLIGALAMMWFSSRNTKTIPTDSSNIKQFAEFQIEENDRFRGPIDAKVTLVEFMDFQCPACASYYPLLDALLDDYPDDLNILFKHFPLKTIHSMAEPAGRAAEAAGLQGKFWEMHDILFEKQNEWSRKGPDTFLEYAQSLDLDLEKFESDFKSKELKDKIDKDFSLSIDLGLNSTPTFYLNGELISNPGSYEDFKLLIEEHLRQNEL